MNGPAIVPPHCVDKALPLEANTSNSRCDRPRFRLLSLVKSITVVA